MTAKDADHPAWGLATVLAVVLVGGIAVLGVWLKPYWVAKYRGAGADLRGAMLIHAPLHRAVLESADLRGADLRGANLKDAYLGDADLAGADLRRADLRGAEVYLFSTGDGVLLPQTMTSFRGALYDRDTRWPSLYKRDAPRAYPFNPQRLGGILAR